VQTLGEVPDSFAVTAEHTDRLQSQAERIPQAEVLRAIDLLAAALSAVKDGSDPRIQLEIALLKSAQPKADASVQALMARIDRLEQALGGSAPVPPPVPKPDPPRAAAANGAPAAVAEPDPTPDTRHPTPSFDLEHLQSLWPAAVEAVRGENAMVGALLAEARPAELEGNCLTVAFAEGAAFSKKKAENNRALLAKALRDLTGHSLELVYELRDGEDGHAGYSEASSSLDEEQLIERLKQEFGATDFFDDEGS
jgi:DNA polymerase III subunit gamma/tau